MATQISQAFGSTIAAISQAFGSASSGSSGGTTSASGLQAIIDAQIAQLTSNVNAILAQNTSTQLAGVFIDSQLTLTDNQLDELASELVNAGSSQAYASVDANVATNLLNLDLLNALFDLGITNQPSASS